MLDLTEAVHGQAYVRPPFPGWLLVGGRVSLAVSSPPDVVVATIKDNTANAIFHAFSPKPLIGRVSGDGHMVIGANTRLNACRSFLDARIAPYNRGSLIEGRFRLSFYVLVLTVVWLGFAALFLVTSLVGQIGSMTPVSVLSATLFPLVFFGVVAIQRLFALEGEEKVVRQLIRLGSADRPIG